MDHLRAFFINGRSLSSTWKFHRYLNDNLSQSFNLEVILYLCLSVRYHSFFATLTHQWFYIITFKYVIVSVITARMNFFKKWLLLLIILSSISTQSILSREWRFEGESRDFIAKIRSKMTKFQILADWRRAVIMLTINFILDSGGLSVNYDRSMFRIS